MKKQLNQSFAANPDSPEVSSKADKTARTFGFFGLLLLFLILAGLLLWPFYKLIALAGILAVLFLPMYKFLLHRTKSELVAAILTVFAILAIVITPLYFISQAVVKEAVVFYVEYQQGGIVVSPQMLIDRLPDVWQGAAENLAITVKDVASSWAHSFILDFAGLVSNVADFFFSFFLLFFIIFFLLKDHGKLRKYLEGLFPLSRKRGDFLIKKLESSINGVVKGDFLIALLQGGTAAVGFIFTGVPQPILWTLATILSSFIPAIGTSLIIVPAIIYLLLFKSLISAVILTAWYIVVHLIVDNIIGPKLIGQQARLHPLLVLLSILGGLKIFGALGFLYGPIIMAIFTALVDAYRINAAFNGRRQKSNNDFLN